MTQSDAIYAIADRLEATAREIIGSARLATLRRALLAGVAHPPGRSGRLRDVYEPWRAIPRSVCGSGSRGLAGGPVCAGNGIDETVKFALAF